MKSILVDRWNVLYAWLFRAWIRPAALTATRASELVLRMALVMLNLALSILMVLAASMACLRAWSMAISLVWIWTRLRFSLSQSPHMVPAPTKTSAPLSFAIWMASRVEASS